MSSACEARACALRLGLAFADLAWRTAPRRRRQRPALVQRTRALCDEHDGDVPTDGSRLYVDMDMALKNQFPFMPNLDGSPFDPVGAQGHVTRLLRRSRRAVTSRLRDGDPHPENGVLSRQDDRYHTVPYGVGFMSTLDATRPMGPALAASAMPPFNGWTRFDHVAAQNDLVLRRNRYERAGVLLRTASRAGRRG